jgi:hypothetical protein
MATKNSRYRTNPAVVGPDVRGRITLAQHARPLPAVTGTFRHVLADGDRVDVLADPYYGDPMAWWQICDANPEFLSPWALFGQEPVITVAFTVAPRGDQSWEQLWSTLFDALSALPGVERITVADSGATTAQIAVTHNRLSSPNLKECITAAGFTVESATASSRVGKQIVIPPVESG